MDKVVKDHYEEIMSDLEPLFKKWGAKAVNGAMWRYTRTRSRLQELKEEQERINKELKKYEKST